MPVDNVTTRMYHMPINVQVNTKELSIRLGVLFLCLIVNTDIIPHVNFNYQVEMLI